MNLPLFLPAAIAKIVRLGVVGLFIPILTLMFAMADATVAHAQITTWTISPGGLQTRLGEPANITISTSTGDVPNDKYSGNTDGSEGNADNILNLVKNAGLKNSAGRVIKFPQAVIVNGEVQITANQITGITGNVTIDNVPNPPPPALPTEVANGDLEVGGLLAGLDANGDEANYDFELGYGDETGTITSLAQVDLTFADLTDQTIPGLLTDLYEGLDAQLPAALQDDLTLDLADNALNFAFPTSIENPTVEGYSSDVGLTYNDSIDLTPIPEPGTLTLFGTGLLGLAGVVQRKVRRG